MGYFASFLMMHLFFRHRFTSTGFPILDQLWRLIIYAGLIGWAGIVCYSRYIIFLALVQQQQSNFPRLHLTYHTGTQILWGVGVGTVFGALTYTVAELIPAFYPKSKLGYLRTYILAHPIATWLRIKDGWAVSPDGGREEDWLKWRERWEKKRALKFD